MNELIREHVFRIQIQKAVHKMQSPWALVDPFFHVPTETVWRIDVSLARQADSAGSRDGARFSAFLSEFICRYDLDSSSLHKHVFFWNKLLQNQRGLSSYATKNASPIINHPPKKSWICRNLNGNTYKIIPKPCVCFYSEKYWVNKHVRGQAWPRVIK